MLDAISDFWKPSKKQDDSETLDASELQIGASIGFGFIPQGLLSGKRATIQSINTYEFSGDRLTSYVLNIDGDSSVSLIIADGQGEKYIALSRRIPFAERMRMLDNNELLACMDNAEQKRLHTKQPEGEWRNWLADQYKKAIHGLKGTITEGDYRSISTPPNGAEIKEFSYTLLVSSNNEYAIEIEQYSDNRMEVYATVYRRLTDVGEVKSQAAVDVPQVETKPPVAPPQKSSSGVAATAKELAALKPANDTKGKEQPMPLEATKPIQTEEAPIAKTPQLVSNQDNSGVAKSSPVLESGKTVTKPLVLDSLKDLKDAMMPKVDSGDEAASVSKTLPDFQPAKAVVPTIQSLSQPQPVTSFPRSDIKPKPRPPEAVAEFRPEQNIQRPPEVKKEPVFVPKPETKMEEKIEETVEEKIAPAEVKDEKAMNEDKAEQTAANLVDAVFKEAERKPTQTVTSTYKESEVMATYNATFNGKPENIPQAEVRGASAIAGQEPDFENDTVECELPAANRVIEEAIRNEMRMSDVVRRIIALPVAQQEQVQIPVVLTDSDYHLLAIRYGIPAADRAAIKAKIVEEINDFSGSRK